MRKWTLRFRVKRPDSKKNKNKQLLAKMEVAHSAKLKVETENTLVPWPFQHMFVD
jgi:hypothetical protein